MSLARLKNFQSDVKETLKATKDSYLIFAIILLAFISLISLVASYLLPFLIIPLLYVVIAPFLLAVVSYFIAPSKQALEQKQKYFFRLVRQYYRLDSLRVLLPFRNVLFPLLISYFVGMVALFIALSYGLTYDAALQTMMDQYSTLLVNQGTVEQLNAVITSNMAVFNYYLPFFIVTMSFVFLLLFTYLLVKRFFFVYVHINLFTKTRYKVDYVKTTLYNGPFYRQHVRGNYLIHVLPIFLFASLLFMATTIFGHLFLQATFDIMQVIVFASALYLLVLFIFIPYFCGVNLVIFGHFMEKYALQIYQTSIDDIEQSVINPNLSNEEKENLLNIKRILEQQKVLFMNERDKKQEEANSDNNQ